VTSLGKFPDPFAAEIAGQPEALRRAADGLTDQAEALRRIPQARGRLVVFTGMGGSFHTCYPAVVELAAAGIPALHLAASELLHFRRSVLDARAVVVAVSQSGESAEVVRLALDLARSGPRPLLASVTNGLSNRLVEVADVTLDTRAGPEAGPSTLTFAGSLVMLSAVAGVLAGDPPPDAVERTRSSAFAAAEAAERLLGGSGPFALRTTRWAGGRRSLAVLGRGPARAASEMGALIVKEAAGVAAEAFDGGQFRHGPVELAGPELAAIVLATEPETRDLDVALADRLAEAGAAVLLVTESDAVAQASGASMSVAIGPVRRALRPAVSIIPAQLLAWGLAVERGRVPGTLTRATKVTTRE